MCVFVIDQGGFLPDQSARETRHSVADTLRHCCRHFQSEDRPHPTDHIQNDPHVLQLARHGQSPGTLPGMIVVINNGGDDRNVT